MSHTPGPWEAAARQGDDWESVVYVPGTPNEICQCFHTSMSLGGKENCEANARLIAAAPELLDACKAVIADVGLNDLIAGVGEGVPPFWAQVKAAIAKAEGRHA